MIYTIKVTEKRAQPPPVRDYGITWDTGLTKHAVLIDDTLKYADQTYVEAIRFVMSQMQPGDTLHEVYLQGFDRVLTYDELMADKFRLECAAVQP